MSENENLDLNKYNIFYICMLTFCLIVVLLDIVGFFKFRAYNNLSSAMLHQEDGRSVLARSSGLSVISSRTCFPCLQEAHHRLPWCVPSNGRRADA